MTRNFQYKTPDLVPAAGEFEVFVVVRHGSVASMANASFDDGKKCFQKWMLQVEQETGYQRPQMIADAVLDIFQSCHLAAKIGEKVNEFILRNSP